MIAPLRQRHRWVTGLLLFAFLPALFVLALARPQGVPAAALPDALATAPTPSGPATFEDANLLSATAVSARVFLNADGTSVLELQPTTPLARPDVLVYWGAEAPAGGGISADAFLLGALGDHRRAFTLPDASTNTPGHLFLLSLGHGEILDTAELPATHPGDLP
jgi:hypothetical protein